MKLENIEKIDILFDMFNYEKTYSKKNIKKIKKIYMILLSANDPNTKYTFDVEFIKNIPMNLIKDIISDLEGYLDKAAFEETLLFNFKSCASIIKNDIPNTGNVKVKGGFW